MRLVFADQPLLSVPRTTGAFASDALDATPFAYVLRAESGELFSGPDLDVIVLALSGGSWFRSTPALGLRLGASSRRHPSPRFLRFLDVLPCGFSLFCGSHLSPPCPVTFKNFLKNERTDSLNASGEPKTPLRQRVCSARWLDRLKDEMANLPWNWHCDALKNKRIHIGSGPSIPYVAPEKLHQRRADRLLSLRDCALKWSGCCTGRLWPPVLVSGRKTRRYELIKAVIKVVLYSAALPFFISMALIIRGLRIADAQAPKG